MPHAKAALESSTVDLQQVKAEGGGEAKPAEVQCDWKEFTSPDGRKYYYNRVTKSSVWQMPEELKTAQALAAGVKPKAEGNSVQVCCPSPFDKTLSSLLFLNDSINLAVITRSAHWVVSCLL